MDRIWHDVTVEPDQEGERIDRALARWFGFRSRTAWQRAIVEGQVEVGGRPVKPHYVLQSGDVIRIAEAAKIPAADAVKDAPEPPVQSDEWIVYQDRDILVINKPRGLVAHPGAGHWQDSVVHRLAPWLDRTEDGLRPGIVHRLDRDTTGLMLVARHEAIRRRLSLALAERRVHRRYVAVVRGRPASLAATIDAPVGRDPKNRLKMAVVVNGRPARTAYRTLVRWDQYSLLQFTLFSGRTHQIRVHMAAVGHPLVGDPTYGGASEGIGAVMAGQALHAGQLALTHPVTGKLLCFEAWPPADWGDLGAALGPLPEIVEEDVYPPLPGFECPGAATRDLLRYLGAAGG